jgi:multidrug efflux pump subunit AcrA (membrane-fusion protein)
MSKTLKKVILGVVIAAAVVAAVWGILTVLRTARRKPVNVYPVESFMTTNEWGSSSQSSGTVTTDKLQKIYLSESQTVSQVYVTEGQAVKKGDKLLSYDTTLTSLALERAKIDLERQENYVESLKAQLKRLEDFKHKALWEARMAFLEKELQEAEALAREAAGSDTATPLPDVSLITGQDGTKAHPYYMPESDFTPDRMDQLRSDQGDGDIYVVLYHHDAEEGDIVSQGVVLLKDNVITFFDPPFEVPTASDTASADAKVKELRRQVAEAQAILDDPTIPTDLLDYYVKKDAQEKIIDQAQVGLKIAQMDFQRKSSEVADASVYSEMDGVVKAVRDPKTAYQNGEAVVEVSGGGGYYVSGVISELELGNVQIGDTVQINSWMTGVSCEGTIVSVEDYPASQSGWSNGNQNVSYYPFKAFVSEDANLQPNDYVDISYRSGSSKNAWYLESMFIRVDNGKSYVYVRGENGLLEKRDVVTGADLWGSYTEIRSGLTRDDLVAFPYGQDVVEGAKTQEATPDQLYNY